MNSSDKLAGVVTVAVCATIVAIFALMTDCSKTSARYQTEAVECTRAGGQWNGLNDGTNGGICSRSVK